MNSATAAAAADPRSMADRLVGLRRERIFFSGMAIAMTLVAFVGFAPSYYLKARFGARHLS